MLQQQVHETISSELNSNQKMLNEMLRIIRKEMESKIGHYGILNSWVSQMLNTMNYSATQYAKVLYYKQKSYRKGQ